MGMVFPLYSLFFVTFKTPLMAVFFAAGCVLAGLVVGIFAWLINSRPVIRLARRLNVVLSGIADGSGTDVDELIVDSNDALGLLAENFRKGILMFRSSIQETRETASRTVHLSGEVEHNLIQTMESTEILYKTIDLISKAAEELDGQNSEMERGFDQLSKATLLNVTNVIELYTNINDFGATIYKQTESLRELIDTLAQIERSIGSGASAASGKTLIALQDNLSRRAADTVDATLSVFNGVRESLEKIDGIAERTNVLSINAAIEAARLGKDGSGFRIIASNIKNLAAEVQQLTSLINAKMEEGEQSLIGVTKELNGAISSQTDIISGIRVSIGALSRRNEAVSEQMHAMEHNRTSIDGILKDIKENMQKLKDQISSTHEALNFAVNTSAVIHAGIGTLSEKAIDIDANGREVKKSLELFKNSVSGITLS